MAVEGPVASGSVSVAAPEVSVVMSVWNGGPQLRDTLQSVLGQADVDLELIVVDDGSTDETAAILAEGAEADRRVRILSQPNAGLTRALRRGCAEARGRFIARQDAGDLSLPGRLRRQRDRLQERPRESLVSCWTRFVGPEDEPLYAYTPADDPAANTAALRVSDVARVRSPVGAAAFFRREDYAAVGGYREAFHFAQDLDLWLRLTDRGAIGVVPEQLYEARVAPSSLSGRHRAEQVALASLSLELVGVRAAGGDEAPLLSRASAIAPRVRGDAASRGERASGYYFVGKCLLDRGDRRCRKYLRQALEADPLNLRAAAALVASAWRVSA